ncbi:class I SAM-dependent methyltransferase [Paraburkholderia susongensis]|uniref:Methyltransferase domain-containing protein n=1 Tax=Paraburkholderia susongensis TaxID=1515439 RepID=A0A1X7J3E0_9BURK|nr:class I SAM-dependent methyltransferase [Paraburkholderia susongensis]SMG22158.1 Methyltransferase domain-containing protein [Paraburkholderia susongensis]
MAQFHFVEDYERFVDNLVKQYPIDEAMARAVGGSYDDVGEMELNILRHAGLKDGMAVFDLGCGSGRLASALGRSGMDLDYLGTDIVQALLDYAKTKSPEHYRFIKHAALSIPAENSSVDVACAFSVFTHLLHHETYQYLEAMRHAVKPGGRVVFSFLEFADAGHWSIFEHTIHHQRMDVQTPLNSFIERSVIDAWAQRIGFRVVEYINGNVGIGGGAPLGQSTAILERI